MLSKDDIEQLYHSPNPNNSRIIFNWSLLALGLCAVIAAIYFLMKRRLSATLKREKQQLELHNLILETELRVNRALMNPHFVFNSLNALQNFILKKQNNRAYNYLVKFSKLMRKILENNMSDRISLDKEIDFINKYLEIENLRFEEDISYTIYTDAPVVPSAIQIPIMILQPFIENAIWHGLLKKTGDKILKISFFLKGSGYLKCIIDDNGLGRKVSETPAPGKKSLGIAFVEQRLRFFNKIYDLNCTLSIEDKPESRGTTVTIILPILNK